MKSTNNNKKKNMPLLVRIELTLALIAATACIVFAFVLSPLTAYANNDGTIPYLPDILETLQWFLNLTVFFICYALTEYCIYRFDRSSYCIIIVTYASFTVLKYVLNVCSAFFVFDTVPIGEELLVQLTLVGVNTVAELLQYIAVVTAALLILEKHKKLSLISEKNAAKIGVAFDKRDKVFPMNSLLSFKNPLQKATFVSSIIVVFFMVSQRIFYDISIGLSSSLTDMLWMILAYLSDAVFGAIGYIIGILVLNKCDLFEIKMKSN